MMTSCHSNAQTEVATAVVTVAVEPVLSSFSAVTVVGVDIALIMEAVESVASSFPAVFFFVFLFLLLF